MIMATNEDQMNAFHEDARHLDEETWQARVEFAVTCALILFFGAMLLGN